MFVDNERVKAELFQTKPKGKAKKLLKDIKAKLTIQAHLDEIDAIIKAVEEM